MNNLSEKERIAFAKEKQALVDIPINGYFPLKKGSGNFSANASIYFRLPEYQQESVDKEIRRRGDCPLDYFAPPSAMMRG